MTRPLTLRRLWLPCLLVGMLPPIALQGQAPPIAQLPEALMSQKGAPPPSAPPEGILEATTGTRWFRDLDSVGFTWSDGRYRRLGNLRIAPDLGPLRENWYLEGWTGSRWEGIGLDPIQGQGWKVGHPYACLAYRLSARPFPIRQPLHLQALTAYEEDPASAAQRRASHHPRHPPATLTLNNRTFRLDLTGWEWHSLVQIFEGLDYPVEDYGLREWPELLGPARLDISIEDPGRPSTDAFAPGVNSQSIPMGGMPGILRVSRTERPRPWHGTETFWTVSASQTGANWRLRIQLTTPGPSPDSLVTEARRLAASLRRMAGMPTHP